VTNPSPEISQAKTETIRIAMWSGPRNISTAMMRAWENRADTQVTDEPFYAAYLATTGLDHPMREAVIAAQPVDWEECARLCAGETGTPIHFQKHMCQHMIAQAPLGWMAACRHAFLIRPPEAVAASFHKGWAGMGADDLGFRRQAELFDHVCTRRAGGAGSGAEGTVRGFAGGVRPGDAGLARRAARQRRGLGGTLVCAGEPVDRVRALSAAGLSATGTGARPAERDCRRVQALLRPNECP
jgi:hypothetical protein